MTVRRPTVYVETTVPSYLVARPSSNIIIAGHQLQTHKWWDTRRQRFECFVSAATIKELSAGDPALIANRLAAIAGIEVLPEGEVVDELGAVYRDRLGLTGAARNGELGLHTPTIVTPEELMAETLQTKALEEP